jgi:hypothetical protein
MVPVAAMMSRRRDGDDRDGSGQGARRCDLFVPVPARRRLRPEHPAAHDGDAVFMQESDIVALTSCITTMGCAQFNACLSASPSIPLRFAMVAAS